MLVECFKGEAKQRHKLALKYRKCAHFHLYVWFGSVSIKQKQEWSKMEMVKISIKGCFLWFKKKNQLSAHWTSALTVVSLPPACWRWVGQDVPFSFTGWNPTKFWMITSGTCWRWHKRSSQPLLSQHQSKFVLLVGRSVQILWVSKLHSQIMYVHGLLDYISTLMGCWITVIV